MSSSDCPLFTPPILNNYFATEILIIGAGAAGLALAIRLAKDFRVTVLLKDSLPGGASYLAQGGMAAAVSENDSYFMHSKDTINAGANLCKPKVVNFVTEKAREQVEWLLEQNVPFSIQTSVAQNNAQIKNKFKNLHLMQEGGHGCRRIVHVNDATGAAIQAALITTAKNLPNLQILLDKIAVDLLLTSNKKKCTGALIYSVENQNLELWHSKVVVLATGGASQAWLHATGSDSATGDGIAMAWRAGCSVANLEFNQFHPTCLFIPYNNRFSRLFLLSEALRGEGAKLLLPNFSGFMQNYHPMAELAPRDIVALAIDTELKKHSLDHLYLDISHRPAYFIRRHFPTIYAHCKKFDLDITKGPIPIVPAAHYTCGGVMANLHGATDLINLYAIGEVACTGLHGANRIASNSLLECFVFAQAAALDILSKYSNHNNSPDITYDANDKNIILTKNSYRALSMDMEVFLQKQIVTLRQVMTEKVGIVRSTSNLHCALDELNKLEAMIEVTVKIYRNYEYENSKNVEFYCSSTAFELRNLLEISKLIIRSALARKESRGAHFMSDYPLTNPGIPRDTILEPF